MSDKANEYIKELENASAMLRYCTKYADQMYYLDIIKKNSADLKRILTQELRKK